MTAILIRERNLDLDMCRGKTIRKQDKRQPGTSQGENLVINNPFDILVSDLQPSELGENEFSFQKPPIVWLCAIAALDN